MLLLQDFSTCLDGLPLNWISKQYPEKTVAALVDENLRPIRRVTLDNTTRLTVEVHGQELKKCHSFFDKVNGFSLGKICRAVEDTDVCPGVNSQKYTYLWSRYPEAVVDNYGARATLRASTCLLLGHFIGPCPRCCQLRGNLQSSHSRANKRQQHQPSVNMNPLQALFWKEQVKAFSCKGPSGMKWNPMMIRLAIHLEAKSSGSYESLRKTGVVRLPCKTTLRDYTDLHPEKEGLRHHNLATRGKETCSSSWMTR